MFNVCRDLIANQFQAALCTLDLCVQRCPESLWNAPIGNLAFCQVAFHTLFFTDVYLGRGEEGLRDQPFHRENAHVFRDYEELEDRPQKLFYDQQWIIRYIEYCRAKASATIEAETAESLSGPSGFDYRKFSRAELYVYSLRHIQHHAAQLSLRLRLDAGIDIPWVGSGWRRAVG